MDASFPFLPPGWSVDVRNGQTELYFGKRGMIRAGGSASRIIGDRSATDPGAGRRVPGGRQPAWQEWGVSADLTEPQIHRFLGATPQRIANDVNVRCRMTLEKCQEVRHQGCRSLLWGWAEVQWLHRDVQWVNIDGGCGLREWVGRRRRNL